MFCNIGSSTSGKGCVWDTLGMGVGGVGGVFRGTSDLDLGQKLGSLKFWGGGVRGYSRDFRFGLRTKSWKFEIFGGYSGMFRFGLRRKSWKFGFLGGYSGMFRFGLRTKSWNFGFFGGVGYSRNFGFGLRTKSWNFGFGGGIPGT